MLDGGGDLALVGARIVQLLLGGLDQVLQLDPVVSGFLAERRGGDIDRNTNAPAVCRERLDIGLTWNVDVEHFVICLCNSWR